MGFVSGITVSFADNVTENWSHTYSILPFWAGKIFGTFKIPIESMRHTIEKITIEKKDG